MSRNRVVVTALYDDAVPALLAVIISLVLTTPFGVVEGSALAADDDGMSVEITIEVDRTFEAVLIRPFSSFQELPPTALVAIDSNTWGGIIEFPTATDWRIIFDAFEPAGETFRSDSMSLTEIGVDPAVVAGDPEPPVNIGFDSAKLWLIAAMLGMLGALGALAWWTFAGNDEPPTTDD